MGVEITDERGRKDRGCAWPEVEGELNRSLWFDVDLETSYLSCRVELCDFLDTVNPNYLLDLEGV